MIWGYNISEAAPEYKIVVIIWSVTFVLGLLY
jgi:hypothetical protein